jgi:dihydroorotate dehydrogenase electron transfer subunit
MRISRDRTAIVSTKHLYNAAVVDIRRVGADTYILRLVEPLLSRITRAGQFVEIKIPQCADILWRRPFSVHDIHPDSQTIDLLFQAIGRGTAALTSLKSSDFVDVLGPLGNSFVVDKNVKQVVAVAGGLGIAPFKLLMRELCELQIPMILFYGAGRKEQLCCIEDFREYADVQVSTIDGSYGHTGVVTDLLIEYLQKQPDIGDQVLFACGPTPMLRRVQEIIELYPIRAQVSVETVMACGFGACVGCAVPMRHPIPGKKEYFLACKDGPVFKMDEIIFDD